MEERRGKGVTVYSIMPEYAGAYGWIRRNHQGPYVTQLGPNSACRGGWGGDHAISEDLHRAFRSWQLKFELRVMRWESPSLSFDWQSFHSLGLELTRQLRSELPPEVRVLYRKPSEDPDHVITQAWEIMKDGTAVEVKLLIRRAGE